MWGDIMSQDRFDHLEKMMEQLIRMVGHNNAIAEELCQRMDNIETRFDSFETKVDKLKAKVSNLETRFDNLETRSDKLETRFDNLEVRFDKLEAKAESLETKMDNGFDGLTRMVHILGDKTEAIPRIESKIDVLNHRLFEQEAEISLLKRAK